MSEKKIKYRTVLVTCVITALVSFVSAIFTEAPSFIKYLTCITLGFLIGILWCSVQISKYYSCNCKSYGGLCILCNQKE